MGHHKHHYSLNSFIHDVGKVTKPIHKDIASLVSGANKDLNHIVDTQSNIANNLINKSSSTLSSLSMPLMLVGGAVLIYMVTKK
jgi:uncharacterized ion transporter superfamily protein YfcC